MAVRRRLVGEYAAGLLLAATVASAQTAPPSKVGTRDCAALTALRLAEVRLTSAAPVPADPAALPVPHCKVLGVISTEIRFQVLLPDSWNGRFLMGGNGGFAGSLDGDGVRSVSDGYAFASTDTGHEAAAIDGRWALNNPERIANWGHVGVHRTAETAKAIVRAYYGRDPARAYFMGCSNGGRQALMEAQRYPQDFDGLISGAPAYDITNIGGGFIKNIKAVFPKPDSARTPVVTRDNLALIQRASLDACDASDGVRDTVIDSPQQCKFSLSAIKSCPGDAPAPDCLTRAQRQAIQTIYSPAVSAGNEIYPGQPVGAEADENGWPLWITGVDEGVLASTNGRASSLQLAFGPELFKYFMLSDPSWDYTTYDFTTFAHDTAKLAPIVNAENPDLGALKKRGGKVIIWHGWADPALNAASTINYYRRVQQRDPHAGDYSRLYLLPGVAHCNGGPGPHRVEWLDAMVDWVEHGKAPQRLIAKKTSADRPQRTRPVCPYPQHAVYKGTGSTDLEENFVCR
jgi:pimeloyl-ACP methyl ester carboxylesterase